MRFNALLRLIAAVSHRMLTLTLRGLEHDGLRALSEWALKHQPAIQAARGSNKSAATEAAVVEASSQERAALRSSRRG